jgi:hypothetical protein
VFLPQQYKVADLGGDAIAARLFPPVAGDPESSFLPESIATLSPGVLSPGMIGGVITDSTGAVVPNTLVNLIHSGLGRTWQARTGSDGSWTVANVPSGTIRITVERPGFQSINANINHDASTGSRRNLTLHVGATAETVTVEAASANLETSQTSWQRSPKPSASQQAPPPSANVNDLQRRVAGVLPIAVTVPRTGTSYRFGRPLVVDEETRLTFSYRSK